MPVRAHHDQIGPFGIGDRGDRVCGLAFRMRRAKVPAVLLGEALHRPKHLFCLLQVVPVERLAVEEARGIFAEM